MVKRKKISRLPTRSKLLNQGRPYKKRKLDKNETQNFIADDPFAFTEDDNSEHSNHKWRSRKSSNINKSSSGSRIAKEPPNSHIWHTDSYVRRSNRKRAAPPSVFEDFVPEVVPEKKPILLKLPRRKPKKRSKNEVALEKETAHGTLRYNPYQPQSQCKPIIPQPKRKRGRPRKQKAVQKIAEKVPTLSSAAVGPLEQFAHLSLINPDTRELERQDIAEFRLLSVRQPWGEALLEGFKKIENRNYPIPEYLGDSWFGLYCSQKFGPNERSYKGWKGRGTDEQLKTQCGKLIGLLKFENRSLSSKEAKKIDPTFTDYPVHVSHHWHCIDRIKLPVPISITSNVRWTRIADPKIRAYLQNFLKQERGVDQPYLPIPKPTEKKSYQCPECTERRAKKKSLDSHRLKAHGVPLPTARSRRGRPRGSTKEKNSYNKYNNLALQRYHNGLQRAMTERYSRLPNPNLPSYLHSPSQLPNFLLTTPTPLTTAPPSQGMTQHDPSSTILPSLALPPGFSTTNRYHPSQQQLPTANPFASLPNHPSPHHFLPNFLSSQHYGGFPSSFPNTLSPSSLLPPPTQQFLFSHPNFHLPVDSSGSFPTSKLTITTNGNPTAMSHMTRAPSPPPSSRSPPSMSCNANHFHNLAVDNFSNSKTINVGENINIDSSPPPHLVKSHKTHRHRASDESKNEEEEKNRNTSSFFLPSPQFSPPSSPSYLLKHEEEEEEDDEFSPLMLLDSSFLFKEEFKKEKKEEEQIKNKLLISTPTLPSYSPELQPIQPNQLSLPPEEHLMLSKSSHHSSSFPPLIQQLISESISSDSSEEMKGEDDNVTSYLYPCCNRHTDELGSLGCDTCQEWWHNSCLMNLYRYSQEEITKLTEIEQMEFKCPKCAKSCINKIIPNLNLAVPSLHLQPELSLEPSAMSTRSEVYMR